MIEDQISSEVKYVEIPEDNQWEIKGRKYNTKLYTEDQAHFSKLFQKKLGEMKVVDRLSHVDIVPKAFDVKKTEHKLPKIIATWQDQVAYSKFLSKKSNKKV